MRPTAELDLPMKTSATPQQVVTRCRIVLFSSEGQPDLQDR